MWICTRHVSYCTLLDENDVLSAIRNCASYTLYFNDSVRSYTVWYIWYYITNRVTNTFTSAIYQICSTSVLKSHYRNTIYCMRTPYPNHSKKTVCFNFKVTRYVPQYFDIPFWTYIFGGFCITVRLRTGSALSNRGPLIFSSSLLLSEGPP